MADELHAVGGPEPELVAADAVVAGRSPLAVAAGSGDREQGERSESAVRIACHDDESTMTCQD